MTDMTPPLGWPWLSIDGHEDRAAHLAADRLREVPLARDVLDEKHLAGVDDPLLAVARRDLNRAVQVDDVLAARRGVPVEIVVARGLAEDDAGGGEALGELAVLRSGGIDR